MIDLKLYACKIQDEKGISLLKINDNKKYYTFLSTSEEVINYRGYINEIINLNGQVTIEFVNDSNNKTHIFLFSPNEEELEEIKFFMNIDLE